MYLHSYTPKKFIALVGPILLFFISRVTVELVLLRSRKKGYSMSLRLSQRTIVKGVQFVTSSQMFSLY